MTYISTVDLTAFTGAPVDALRADLAVAGACDMVRMYLGQQIDHVAGDVVKVSGAGTKAILLPELPVTAVNSVTIDGAAVDDWELGDGGVVWRVGGDYRWWPHGTRNITVDYDHGYVTVPPDIKLVTVQVAKLIYDEAGRPAGLTQRSIGDYSEGFAGSAITRVDASRYLAVLERRAVKQVPVP